MLKQKIKTSAASCIIIMIFSAIPIAAQDSGGVNSSAIGLNIHGGLGYGQSAFGIIDDSSGTGDLGTGPGGAADLGAMLNISVLAFSVNFVQANFNKMEYKENGDTYESEGDGYFRTWEFLLGLKIFTEEDDMGYTLLYGGYKMWSAERNVDSVTLNGVDYPPLANQKYELEGDGWVAGFRDLSTLNLAAFSLALQTGLWVEKMPISSIKQNGVEDTRDIKETAGFGGELGLGLAFESIGFSVIASVKMDITASAIEDISGEDDAAGSGYAQFFITATKDFSI